MLNLKSELVVKVLGYYFLNPEARFYVRELAELLKLDPGNLSRKMIELKKDGLFITEKEGKNIFYSLNRKFPLLEEYKNIYEDKFGLIESLKQVLGTESGLVEAYIFGSYAKGNFEEGSDIDLLLIGSHDHLKVGRTLSALEKRWHREINIIDFSSTEFNKKMKAKDFFLDDIFSGKTIKII